MTILNIEKESESDKPRLIFRCERTAWVGSAGDINFRTRYLPLKSKSHGDTSMMEDDMHEIIVDHNFNYHKASDPFIHEGVHGKLYEVTYTNISTDWESGYVDGYDIELKEYTDE